MREETKSQENKQKIMVHEEQKCKSCDKSFSQARDLKKHIHTVHEGHKDHKCEFCGKSFSQGGNLKGHINRIHKALKITTVNLVVSHFHIKVL